MSAGRRRLRSLEMAAAAAGWISAQPGSGSAGVARFSQPGRARQLFCVVRRCAFRLPTLSFSVKREPSSGAPCLACGSRRRRGVRRTWPM